jgi:hypothetical protein
MKLSYLFILLGALALSPFLPQPSFAYSDDPNNARVYIEAGELSPQLLPPPPEEGSKEWHKQIDQVLAAQRTIGPADIASIKDEQHMRLDLMTSMMGDDFTH